MQLTNHIFKTGKRGGGHYQFGCVISNMDGEEVYRWAEIRYFDSLKQANRYWRGLKVERSAMAKVQ